VHQTARIEKFCATTISRPEVGCGTANLGADWLRVRGRSGEWEPFSPRDKWRGRQPYRTLFFTLLASWRRRLSGSDDGSVGADHHRIHSRMDLRNLP